MLGFRHIFKPQNVVGNYTEHTANEENINTNNINFCLICSFLLRFGTITANVSRLKNVAKKQHQAFTNITKTLN